MGSEVAKEDIMMSGITKDKKSNSKRSRTELYEA